MEPYDVFSCVDLATIRTILTESPHKEDLLVSSFRFDLGHVDNDGSESSFGEA